MACTKDADAARIAAAAMHEDKSYRSILKAL
jgi:hypothetical protein